MGWMVARGKTLAKSIDEQHGQLVVVTASDLPLLSRAGHFRNPLNNTAMGNTISLIRHALTELLNSIRMFQALKERINAEPGLPVENPTRSFWMSPPSPVARHCSDLPQHASVVIIGSGITGTSVAKTLLDRAHAAGERPVLLMLEARDACSGATGRYVYMHPSDYGWPFEQYYYIGMVAISPHFSIMISNSCEKTTAMPMRKR